MRNQYNVDEPLVIDGYDSDTIIKDPHALNTVNSILKHRENVKSRLLFLADELYQRAYHHDDSKLQAPEIGWLIEMDKEPRYPYGSPEYFDKMKRWDKFFRHHYKFNRHHPDHFQDGISGMNLADLCEYIVDIISYFEELHVGEALDTVNKQADRFGLDEQLIQILKNTLIEYFTWFGGDAPTCESVRSIQGKPSDEPSPMKGLDISQIEQAYLNKR